MVYDINEKRCAKVLKIGRKYLTWVQNSVFEGEISEAKFFKMKQELKKIINEKEDIIVFYVFPIKSYTDRQIIGIDKTQGSIII